MKGSDNGVCWLVRSSPFPGAVATCVGADRPETGAAAEKVSVAQNENAAIAAHHTVEHTHVKGIEPVSHNPRISPEAKGVETVRVLS
jgi:pyruvoyl-dependent arginine decarboxylase (PvlArgDC)